MRSTCMLKIGIGTFLRVIPGRQIMSLSSVGHGLPGDGIECAYRSLEEYANL